VTWTFDSDLVAGDNFLNGLLNRYFGLLFDQWIGADYEEGLASLKSLAESIADVDFSDLEVIELDAAPTAILYVPTLVDESTFNIADSLAKAYGEITAFMLEHGIEIEAKPLAITRSGRDAGFEIDAAIPLPGTPPELTGNIRYGQTPSGRALQVVHRGTHDRLMMTHQKLEAYMKVHGITPGTVSWEEYVSNPAVTPEEQLLTHIYVLLENDAYTP
jgi:effector-binding domain-containing protein